MLRLITGPLDETYSLSPKITRADNADTVLTASVALSALRSTTGSQVSSDSRPLARVVPWPCISTTSSTAPHSHCTKTLAKPNGRAVSITTVRTSSSIVRSSHDKQPPPQTDDQRGAGCTHLDESTRFAEALTATLKEVERHVSLRTATISHHPPLPHRRPHPPVRLDPPESRRDAPSKERLPVHHIMHGLDQMSTALVWALRAIQLLKLVARRWLPPTESAGLMANELSYLSRGDGAEEVVPVLPGLPDVVGCDPWAQSLWSEGGWVQSGLLFDLGLLHYCFM
ncbi:hypothetical protein BO86DRAFT_394712 [Aspergillus japonicus CBS 114.51]|uniref:Uncharacterized protein n=1 Tax=Aspergillus japonicus CBS 114.51 TaxID=1448312 RepID=A0A8T8XHP8_ASPJA|nr:hypothetical protein BO86DRAFT_394712 [Aspergillus japonicus CBS 114.51]RAH86919.1 hypothetical protein BO86DRAFT_394712 [Aspergillus japonicus CBS 114.51]